MDYDDFNCPLCNTLYDEKKHIPRMLILCGHTYCQECLTEKLDITKENAISCPDDNTKHEIIKKVEDLPKNLTLINLIRKASKRKSSKTYTEQKRSSIPFLSRSSIPRPGKNYLSAFEENINGNNINISNNHIQKDENSQSDSISRKSLNNFGSSYYSQNYPYTTEFSLNEGIPGANYFCNIHRRPLEIACLDHKTKICTSCALFGEHKHHNLKSEEDIIKEVTVKAERLIELYESVEKHADIFESNLQSHQSLVEQTKADLKQNNQKIKEKAKMFFKELRFLLKAKEKEIIEILDDKLEKAIQKKFEYVSKIPKETRKKTIQWKNEVQEYLDNLNNVNESYEILFEFLENKKDLVTPAVNLITDIEAASQIFTKTKHNTEVNFDVGCNFDLFNSNYNDLCVIKENDFENNTDTIHQNNNQLEEKTVKTPFKDEGKLPKDTPKTIGQINQNTVTPKKITFDNDIKENFNLEIPDQIEDDLGDLDKNNVTNLITESNIEDDEKKLNRIAISNLNYANSTGDLLHIKQNNVIDQKSIFNSPNRYSNTGTNFENLSYSTYNVNYNPSLTDNSFMSLENDYNYTTFFRDSKPTGKNKLAMENSFSSETRLNTTTSVTNNRKPSLNSLSADKIVFIKNQLKNEVANFTGYSIADEGAKKITEILLANQFSQSPNKKLVFNKIKELKLTKTGLSDEGFSHIANSVSKLNQIHSVSVNKNKLKDESCVEILNMIKTNKNLKYLNLSSNNFTQDVKDKIKNISRNLNPNLKIEI